MSYRHVATMLILTGACAAPPSGDVPPATQQPSTAQANVTAFEEFLWVREALGPEERAARVRPITDWGNFTAIYYAIRGSLQNPFANDWLRLRNTPQGWLDEYRYYVHYSPEYDRPDGTVQGYVVWTEADPEHVLYPMRYPKWDLKSRTMSLNGVPVVSPAVLPARTPRIRYVTGRLMNGFPENIVLSLSKRETAYVRPHEEFPGFIESWEYEALEMPAGGKVLPRLWAEKTTGVVLAGLGDFSRGENEIDRLAWVLHSVSDTPR